MSFNVSFSSGTGLDDLDKENEAGAYGEPSIIKFATDAERKAFLLGVSKTSAAMDGWVDGWVVAEIV